MQNFQLLEQVQEDIKASVFDIKAEAQLLQSLDKGLHIEDFMVSCNQLFRRGYAHDVVNVELKDNKIQDFLQLSLSRSGIFDHLPEGLFFQLPQYGNKIVTVADMTTDYKENKKKEENIRLFFLPFENDFFLQRMKLEAQENELLNGVRSGMMTDYFNRFWNLPEAIPQTFKSSLAILLPYASKIAGNTKLTTECLYYLLNEEVKIDWHSSPEEKINTALNVPALAEMQLGIDMVPGNSFWEGDQFVEITIGPLLHSNIVDYLEGGERYVLMQTFIDFFLPAGVDVKLTIKPLVEKMHIVLEDGDESILGYTTIL